MQSHLDANDAPGAALGRMLEGHRMFMENIYSLMRFLEAEVTKRGWELVKNGGYSITRNGLGRGLTSFASADWVTNQIGIAFVQAGRATVLGGVTNTVIPPEGLEVLAFQVRWLDKAPGEPVAWHAHLLVEPESGREAGNGKEIRKWEEYQSQVFARLEPEIRADGITSGQVRAGRTSIAGTTIVFTGHYAEIPVTALQAQEDIITQLIEPALAEV